MTATPFTSSTLEEIANYLVNDRDTHAVLNRRFAELGIREPRTEPSPMEERYKAMGLQRGVDYYEMRPSKANRLRHAVQYQFERGGNNSVLHLIKTLNEPVLYVRKPEEFQEFCDGINVILRFYGVEYRDDGEFHSVSPTRTLSEAERRAAALSNKMAHRRVHPEIRKYCAAQYTQENYFHAVVEAYKGLTERIREQTGYTSDGLELLNRSFGRPSTSQGAYPVLAFNTLTTVTEKRNGPRTLSIPNQRFALQREMSTMGFWIS